MQPLPPSLSAKLRSARRRTLLMMVNPAPVPARLLLFSLPWNFIINSRTFFMINNQPAEELKLKMHGPHNSECQSAAGAFGFKRSEGTWEASRRRRGHVIKEHINAPLNWDVARAPSLTYRRCRFVVTEDHNLILGVASPEPSARIVVKP